MTIRCQACDFTTDVVYDAACHSYALGGDHHTIAVVERRRYQGVRRMWVAPAFNGLGADVWCEGINHSRLGGERTLVWENVSYAWARALVDAWNEAAEKLEAAR